jgi:hypothetical protein
MAECDRFGLKGPRRLAIAGSNCYQEKAEC